MTRKSMSRECVLQGLSCFMDEAAVSDNNGAIEAIDAHGADFAQTRLSELGSVDNLDSFCATLTRSWGIDYWDCLIALQQQGILDPTIDDLATLILAIHSAAGVRSPS